jgi:hypothetical protein
VKPSALLTDVRVVLAMLRHDVPGSALAKAAYGELAKACSRFLGAGTEQAWARCVRAAHQLEREIQETGRDSLDPETRKAIELSESKKRRQARRAKELDFRTTRRKT